MKPKIYFQGCGSGSAFIFPFWIRIQEGKISNKNRKNAQVNSNFVRKFAQAPFFLTFEQSFRVFSTKEIFNKVFLNFKAGSGTEFKKQLDPDPH